MKKLNQIQSILFLLIIFISCGGSSGGGSGVTPQEEQDPGGTTGGVDVTIDSQLTKTELRKINESLKLIESLQIDGRRILGFSQIFGGNRSSNVVDYFETRINYVISYNTDYFSRLVLASLLSHNRFDYYAQNPSQNIWYTSLINEPQDVRFQINNKLVDISSTRVGIMQLGNVFTTSDAITDAITLIHEARHSDCPEGALTSEISRWFNGLEPINHSCGQLHGTCPDGSSCDVIPWGPYAIDFIYSLAIERTCSSCTETEIQQARVNANYVQGAAFQIQATLNGEYGLPDMGSTNKVNNDL